MIILEMIGHKRKRYESVDDLIRKLGVEFMDDEDRAYLERAGSKGDVVFADWSPREDIAEQRTLILGNDEDYVLSMVDARRDAI